MDHSTEIVSAATIDKMVTGRTCWASFMWQWPGRNTPEVVIALRSPAVNPPPPSSTPITPNKVTKVTVADWRDGLQIGKRKEPKPTFFNAVRALREAPEWRCVLAYDDFAKRTVMTAPPPWFFDPNEFNEQPWTDVDDLQAWEWLQSQNILVPQRTAAQAIELVAHDRLFNPVLDYLDSVGEWDGVPRIDKAFSKYFGVVDNEYTSTVSRCFFIGAIARVRQPGCQCDSMPILEGIQGLKKSSGCRVLFDPFFTDEIADIGSKDSSMQLQGVWAVEIAELDGMSRADISKVKAFLTRRRDRFRVPYGARPAEFPRSCIFIGTVNPNGIGYWKDETGARRIWPVHCEKPVDLEGLRAARDQLWAEAVSLYENGAAWYITNPRILKLAQAEQAARYAGDPWTDPVLRYVENLASVTISEILEVVLSMEIDRQDQVSMNRVARILKTEEWERYQDCEGGRRVWAYRKPAEKDKAS